MTPTSAFEFTASWVARTLRAADGAVQSAAWPPEAAEPAFARVHTDTRSVQPGDLFVALSGERFDASAFLAQARAAGALAAVVQGEAGAQRLRDAGLPGWVVRDSAAALAELARAWRLRWAGPLLAVTGSNGKTTVTQMAAAIASAWQGPAALATQGNFNNAIGVPLTLLRLRAAHRVAVLELGMNHPGEIAALAALAQPTVGLINNAQREHQEFMHSVEAVAIENGAVLSVLPANGVAVYPADDAYAPLWARLAQPRASLCWASAGDAPVRLLQAQWQGAHWALHAATPAGDLRTRLHLPGAHNVHNALAAASALLALGAPLSAVAAGLDAFEPVRGRSRALARALGTQRLTLVDDSYNANPDSVAAAIASLADWPAPRLLLLGDMGEVGQDGPLFHRQALAQALAAGLEAVWVCGAAMCEAAQALAQPRLRAFADRAALAAALREQLPTLACVWIKGSRFMRMEDFVQTVLDASQPPEGAC